jgi:hypothetical protein
VTEHLISVCQKGMKAGFLDFVRASYLGATKAIEVSSD